MIYRNGKETTGIYHLGKAVSQVYHMGKIVWQKYFSAWFRSEPWLRDDAW